MTDKPAPDSLEIAMPSAPVYNAVQSWTLDPVAFSEALRFKRFLDLQAKVWSDGFKPTPKTSAELVP